MNVRVFYTPYAFTHIAVAALVAVSALLPVAGMAAEDTVTQDPQTGEWVFTLNNPDEPGEQRVLRYTPQNRIEPHVRSSLEWRKGNFVYRYDVQNGKAAKQGIAGVRFDVPKLNLPAVERQPRPLGETTAQAIERVDAEIKAKNEFVQSVMRGPQDWRNNINDKSSNITSFVWLYTMTKGEGMVAGTQGEFAITRPELPGVALMHTRGYTLDGSVAAALPREGPLLPTIEKIFKENDVWTPIMAPAIGIPSPFDAAELARRIRAQVQTWPSLNVMQPAVLDRLNRQFDVLVPAIERRDSKVIADAAKEIMVEAFKPHRGMQHGHCSEDLAGMSEEHLPKTVAFGVQPLKTNPNQPEIARVASRVLVHDMMYLLTRFYIGK